MPSLYTAVTAALLLMPSGTAAASAQVYTDHAYTAIKALNSEWYDIYTGLWDEAWWNSANVLTTLAEFASLRLDDANELNLGGHMLNTWERAQRSQVSTIKTFDADGITVTSNCINDHAGCMTKQGSGGRWKKRQFDYLTNDFYDDSSWWALGVLKAYDVTGDRRYLDSAVIIFEDLRTGLGGPCKGGIFWNKERQYVNAITNELYLFVAAALANRIPQEARFLKIAKDQWNWFNKSGMINKDNLINDGLNSKCKNNGYQTWSYNQGVILGALVELAQATGDASLIDKAHSIANAAIDHLSNDAGVIVETDSCELRPGHCGTDGQQFKGIFVRNLRYLHEASPRDRYKKVILKNADVIWANNRNSKNQLGVAWNGPFVTATVMSQSAALDVLVAAIAVS